MLYMYHLNSSEQRLYDILADTNWYSYGIRTVLKKGHFKSLDQLVETAISLSIKINDKVNFFTYLNVNYVGLESRRLDYERDKQLGINKVEKLIAKGAYQ